MRLNMSILYDELKDMVCESKYAEDFSLMLEECCQLSVRETIDDSDYGLYYWTDSDNLSEKTAFPHYCIYAGSQPIGTWNLSEDTEIIRLKPMKNTAGLGECLKTIFQKYTTWHERLTDAIFDGQSIKKILKIGGEVLHTPVALCNSAGACLVYTGVFPEDYHDIIWDQLFATNSTYTENIHNKLMRDGSLEQENMPMKLAGKESEIHRDVYTVNIMPYNRRTDRIAFLGSTGVYGTISAGELSLQKELSRCLGFVPELINQMQAGYRGVNQLVQDLLDGKKKSEMGAAELLEQFFTNINGFFVVCIDLPDTGKSVKDTRNTISEILKQKLKPSELVLRYKNQVVLILPIDDIFGDITDRTKEIRRLLKKYSVRMGISLLCRDVFQVRIFYQQAELALVFGAEQQEEELYLFQDFAMEYFRRIITEQIPAKEYCHPTVRSLKEYDMLHGTDYLNVLAQMYQCSGNKAKAAEALYIHRNTLAYKLEQIEKVIGTESLDYSDSQYFLLSYDLINGNLRRY